METNLIVSCRRQRQAGACQVSGGVEVEIDSGIVEVNVSDSGLVGIDDVARALFFRGRQKLGECRAVEQYRMTAMARVARDHDWLPRLIIEINYRLERF